MALRVVDEEPQSWFLLEDDEGTLVLDANCNASFVGFSRTVVLDADEVRDAVRRWSAGKDATPAG